MKRFAFVATAGLFALNAAKAQSVDFSYSAVTTGSWSYAPSVSGSEARFTDSAGAVRAAITCARVTRQVSLSRSSLAPAATMSIWTSSASRELASRFDQAALRVTTQTTAYDPLLDALAFSRGRFAILMPGSPALVLPSGPEPAHVFEDCRA